MNNFTFEFTQHTIYIYKAENLEYLGEIYLGAEIFNTITPFTITFDDNKELIFYLKTDVTGSEFVIASWNLY